MDANLMDAVQALVLGMGTVFTGLLTLLLSMKVVGLTLDWKTRRKEQKARELAASNSSTDASPALDEEERIAGEVVAAIALALQLDQEALDEMEAQRLTWTRMFKPFSPWLMDSKTALHTHRIRYRAAGATGTIVRERQDRR